MSMRRFGMVGFVLLGLLIPSLPSFAYEEDTHCLITYIICRSVGFTAPEALTVAAADQGMDDSAGTVANGGLGGVIPNVPEESLWHALDKNGQMEATGILKRKEELFLIALARPTPAEKLKYLGVFFHYQQDTWAHRHHYDGKPHSYDAYTTYNTPFGHAADAHQPDRPPFDPVAAIMNLEDGVKYAAEFLKTGLKRQPDALFANYTAAGGTQDDNWNDSRKGMYFHQLSAAPASASTARKYLTDLIRAQVDAYTSSISFPAFAGRYTADELSFDKARTAFQNVCNTYATALGQQITLPTLQQKVNEGFTNLTTADLIGASTRSITCKNESMYVAKLIVLYTVNYLIAGVNTPLPKTMTIPAVPPGASSTIELPEDLFNSPVLIQILQVQANGTTRSVYAATYPYTFTGNLAFKCSGTSQAPTAAPIP